MILTVLCLHFFARAVAVLPEAPPAPPQNIHVVNWDWLSWTPAPQEGNVTYTVQYSSLSLGSDDRWTKIPACTSISANSCKFPFTGVEPEHGCVKLRVRAERNGLKSVPVEACSQNDGSCTPKYSLTPLPESLTVHLSTNHSLAYEHADHAKHRVYYGKEGELLKDFKDGVSTVTIPGLQKGQRYCIRVQYIVLDQLVGLSSCTKCELIPESKSNSKQTGITVGVVFIVFMVFLTPAMAYVLLFQRGKIKKCIKPPCKIPSHFLPESLPEHQCPSYANPAEEHYDLMEVCASAQRSSGYEHRPRLSSARFLLSADEM